ncbi:hypothetical protein [Cylindrospermopsis raciborskii]|uniref:hypothetical protein n=1 Tax=Cylindrospermopsis raciborskii TaxID=77022 RepID=UPI0026EA6DD0|nr:hypothetical protein [Cylindrospermopsis raciborskii]
MLKPKAQGYIEPIKTLAEWLPILFTLTLYHHLSPRRSPVPKTHFYNLSKS